MRFLLKLDRHVFRHGFNLTQRYAKILKETNNIGNKSVRAVFGDLKRPSWKRVHIFRKTEPTRRIGAEIPEEAVDRLYKSLRPHLPHRGSEEEYSGLGTLKEVRASWDKEQEYWGRWMEARAAVSEVLTGPEKKAWDNATSNIRRRKITLLRTAYNI